MDRKKSIVISGTSTGIGKSCALHLDKLGFYVYAGVRKPADGKKLKKEASDRLKPIILNVTDSESIAEAAHFIAKETGGKLYGLVNNAGVGLGGVLEVTPVDEIKKLMDVNVIGLLETTQAFIPMLRKSNGRIINIGSTSSLLAFPGASVYSASKFAVRAISDSLRLELKPFDMKVILVAPGAIESEIWDKGKTYKDSLRKTISPEISQLYSALIKFGDKINAEMKRIPANEVAKVVANAFISNKPKQYYIVGNDAKVAAKVARLPKGFLDWVIGKRIQRLGK